jgi:putative transposase
MPSKNVLREFEPESYYHIYNRGAAKLPIFLDESDKRYFVSLFDRHLNPDSKILDKNGAPYFKLDEQIELLAYCLMKNHFHILLYMNDSFDSISALLKSISVSYTLYFNLKYKRSGHLFQGTYKARKITTDEYLLHISRYIHLNPRNFVTFRYSSIRSYLDPTHANYLAPGAWLSPNRMIDQLDGIDYLAFCNQWLEEKYHDTEFYSELANK